MVTYCLQYLFILFVLCYYYFFYLLSLKKGSYSALQKYWNSKDKDCSVGCGVKTFTNMIQRWIWDKTTECHILLLGDSTQMFYQLRSSALLEFIPLSDVSISIGTVASQVFLSDQLCPVALILQVLKAGNVSYQLYPLLLYSESCIQWWHTQTRMKTRELTLREKQAIWMLKKRESQLEL